MQKCTATPEAGFNSPIPRLPNSAVRHGNPACCPALQLTMLTWAIIFAVCALIFGLLGFSGLAAGFATIARFLLALFLILLVLVLLFGGSLFHAGVR